MERRRWLPPVRTVKDQHLRALGDARDTDVVVLHPATRSIEAGDWGDVFGERPFRVERGLDDTPPAPIIRRLIVSLWSYEPGLVVAIRGMIQPEPAEPFYSIMESWCFCGCMGLQSIELPSSVSVIGTGAFNGCAALESVDMSRSVTEIRGWAFCGCKALGSIALPNSVTRLGMGAFITCTSLTSIELPDSITEIRESAFQGCVALESVTLPNAIAEIPIQAFQGCRKLQSIRIPDSVTRIGDRAFSNCTGLHSVVLRDPLRVHISDSAFRGCPQGLISN